MLELSMNIRERQRMAMREYAKLLRDGQTVELTLLGLFPPGRYPSFTLSFRDPDGTLIRRSMPATETNKETIRRLWKVAQEANGRLIFTLTKSGDTITIKFDREEDQGAYTYRKTERGALVLRRNEFIDEGADDIPF